MPFGFGPRSLPEIVRSPQRSPDNRICSHMSDNSVQIPFLKCKPSFSWPPHHLSSPFDSHASETFFSSIQITSKTYLFKTMMSMNFLSMLVGQEFRNSLVGWFCSGSLLSLLSSCQHHCGHLMAWPGLEDSIPRWFHHISGSFVVVVCGRSQFLTWASPMTAWVSLCHGSWPPTECVIQENDVFCKFKTLFNKPLHVFITYCSSMTPGNL